MDYAALAHQHLSQSYERVAIAAPLTWMLGVGYRRGTPVSVFAVPSRRATQ